MRRFKKWTATPLRRMGTGLLLMAVGGGLSLVFPPFALLTAVGLYLFLMMGQKTKAQWLNGKDAFCPVCKKETPSQVIVLRTYMYMPIPFVGPAFSRHIADKYYLVCAECANTHLEGEDFTILLVIAAGGLAHVKEITGEEALEMQI